MKLFITPGSPYARMARITVLEKRLESRVEVIVAQTRAANSPYYAINPSGRVPYLVRDDGVGLEESAVICAWLDHAPGRTDVRSAVGRRGMGGAASRSLGQKPVGWTFSLGSRDPAARGRAFTIRDPPRVGTRQPHGRSLGDGDRASLDAGCSQSCADHARLCARAGSEKSQSSLADGTCETLRLVRPHRRTAVVRGDSTASCSVEDRPGTERLTRPRHRDKVQRRTRPPTRSSPAHQ